MNSSYRVLKLQSGEEIIAKIKGKEKGKIILDTPMIFQTTSRSDMFGQEKEITYLKDWLSNTSENTISIPENFIVSWLRPTSNVTRLYDIERNIKQDEFVKKTKPKKPNSTGPLDMDSLLEALDSLKNDLDNDGNTPPNKNNSFFMHMMIPPDMVKELLEQGMLEDLIDDDDDDIDDFYEEVNDHKYTGDQNKDDPNYGNRWTDWNPDPNDHDYL
tara:strand:+ start:912 stop:1556 length:645 start_codon:yes stop_codon:yes gene_type:complete